MTLTATEQLPASQALAAALRADIASGALAPGDKLPSIRDLAKRHRVAVGTAQAAIDLLRADGLIYSSPGRGTFVREDSGVAADAAVQGDGDVHKQLAHLASQVGQLTERVAELEKLVPVPPAAD